MRPATSSDCALAEFRSAPRLHCLDCLSSHGMLDAYEFVGRFLRETPPEQVRPARLITGDDLTEMGLRPGPRFKEILESVEEAQLEGRLKEREEALAFVRSKYVLDLGGIAVWQVVGAERARS
jgi:poly(A) polymerase